MKDFSVAQFVREQWSPRRISLRWRPRLERNGDQRAETCVCITRYEQDGLPSLPRVSRQCPHQPHRWCLPLLHVDARHATEAQSWTERLPFQASAIYMMPAGTTARATGPLMDRPMPS